MIIVSAPRGSEGTPLRCLLQCIPLDHLHNSRVCEHGDHTKASRPAVVMMVVVGDAGREHNEARGLVGLVQTGCAPIRGESITAGGVGQSSLGEEGGREAACGCLHRGLLKPREIELPVEDVNKVTCLIRARHSTPKEISRKLQLDGLSVLPWGKVNTYR